MKLEIEKENSILAIIEARPKFKALTDMGINLTSTKRQIDNCSFLFTINQDFIAFTGEEIKSTNSKIPWTYDPYNLPNNPWVVWLTPRGKIMNGHKDGIQTGGYTSCGEKITDLTKPTLTTDDIDNALDSIIKAWKLRIERMQKNGWSVFTSLKDRHDHRGILLSKKFGF